LSSLLNLFITGFGNAVFQQHALSFTVTMLFTAG